MEIHDRIERYSSFFTIRHRDNGQPFVTLTDNAPESLLDICREAHGDMFPDDTRWNMIRLAFDALTDYTDPLDTDNLHEIADSLVSVYTAELTAWLASHRNRLDYVDTAREEFGPSKDLAGDLMRGQYMEYLEILDAIVAVLTDEQAASDAD